MNTFFVGFLKEFGPRFIQRNHGLLVKAFLVTSMVAIPILSRNVLAQSGDTVAMQEAPRVKLCDVLSHRRKFKRDRFVFVGTLLAGTSRALEQDLEKGFVFSVVGCKWKFMAFRFGSDELSARFQQTIKQAILCIGGSDPFNCSGQFTVTASLRKTRVGGWERLNGLVENLLLEVEDIRPNVPHADK